VKNVGIWSYNAFQICGTDINVRSKLKKYVAKFKGGILMGVTIESKKFSAENGDTIDWS